MKPTRTVSSYVLLIGILGLSIVGGVVAYQIYSASTKSQTTEKQAKAIKPLDGTINQTVIDELKNRMEYTDYQIDSLINVTPTPVATEAAIVAAPESTTSTTTQ